MRVWDSEVIERLRGGIVVSVQTPSASPFHGPLFAAAMAKAAESGGACAIRADGPDDVAAVLASVERPVMGIYTIAAPETRRLITPTLERAAALARAGAQIISVDATRWPDETGAVARLIRGIHAELHLPVQADVACLEDGIAARAEGADLVGSSTTGYPPDASRAGPDIALVRALSRHLDCPVVAERYYTTAAQIDAAFAAGAFAVVVGSAITDVAATTRRLLATHGQLGNSARAEPRIRP